MRFTLFILFFLFLAPVSMGQDKKIDQLEILYDQGYYRKVLRKSRKLLANPEYDYSGLPAYYKALAIFRLADDPKWYKRHKGCMEEAIESYHQFTEHPAYDDYKHAHYYEIASIKTYLDKLGRNLKELGYKEDADNLYSFRFEYFKEIKGKPDNHVHIGEPEVADSETGSGNSYREKITVYAKSLVGIKYVWAGSDEKGFDCSGFTSYVLKKYGIQIPRTASGQMEESKKVKLSNAQKGDLVFFGSGAKITHVGMVVSNKGEELTMVHASTSKGVIVTNVEKSTYWKPKLKGAGTYLE